MYEQAFLDQMKERLIKEKATLEQKIKQLQEPEEGMDNPELDTLVYDAEEDQISESLLENYKKTLTHVNAALERMEKGTYGVCKNSGAHIPKEKLEMEPWIDVC